MKNKSLSALMLFMILANPLFAKTSGQEAPAVENQENPTATADASTIPDFQGSVSFSMPNLQLGIQHFEGDRETKEIKYMPNVKMSWGIDLSYKGYGASYAMELDQAAEDPKNYGKTDYNDFQFYFYLDHWGADLYFQRYSGYYLDNAKTFGIERGDEGSIRPDMKMYSAGFNVYYAFDEKISLYNAMKYRFPDTESRYSFLLMLSPNYFSVKSDSSLIPDSEEVSYGSDAGFRKGEYYSLSIAPGFVYSTKWENNLFLSFMIFGGLGGMSKQSVTDQGKNNSFSACIKANVKFVFGYDSPMFFCGITGLGDGTSTRDPLADKNTGIMSYVIKVDLFAGIRL